MSTAGLYAEVFESGLLVEHCLLIGAMVPRLHHSDGMPVYVVTEHDAGVPITLKDGSTVKLLAYSSARPGPGRRQPDRVVFTLHERLPWSTPIPLFDGDI